MPALTRLSLAGHDELTRRATKLQAAWRGQQARRRFFMSLVEEARMIQMQAAAASTPPRPSRAHAAVPRGGERAALLFADAAPGSDYSAGAWDMRAGAGASADSVRLQGLLNAAAGGGHTHRGGGRVL